jgi:hypothetical protein
VTCAESAASFSTRPSRESLRSMSCLSGAVTSTWRPVISSRMVTVLEEDFSLVDVGIFSSRGISRSCAARASVLPSGGC